MTDEGVAELRRRLASGRWAVGHCRAGAQAGARVLLWPLRDESQPWDGLWEVSFAPPRPFEGATGEDVFVFGSEEQGAVDELVNADIEWEADGAEAQRVVSRDFPDSRIARESKRRDPKR